MLTVARLITRRTSLGLRVDVQALVREFTDAVKEELDFLARPGTPSEFG